MTFRFMFVAEWYLFLQYIAHGAHDGRRAGTEC